MSMVSIRSAQPRDREAIRMVEEHAFGQAAEAGLADALVAGGDAVVELVAEEDGQVVGHILFSRLHVVEGRTRFPAVALAPLAVEPSFHGTGIGGALVPGNLKLAWMTQYVSDWAGLDGRVLSLRAVFRRPDVAGRPIVLAGRVVDKREEGDRKVVELEVVTLAEGDPSVRSNVQVELPSRR